MDVNSEDVMVAVIEENMRGSEHFNDHCLSKVREASSLYLSKKTQTIRMNI